MGLHERLGSFPRLRWRDLETGSRTRLVADLLSMHGIWTGETFTETLRFVGIGVDTAGRLLVSMAQLGDILKQRGRGVSVRRTV
jgi:hypothetical protein